MGHLVFRDIQTRKMEKIVNRKQLRETMKALRRLIETESIELSRCYLREIATGLLSEPVELRIEVEHYRLIRDDLIDEIMLNDLLLEMPREQASDTVFDIDCDNALAVYGKHFSTCGGVGWMIGNYYMFKE